MSELATRPVGRWALPDVTPDTEAFWRGGADGKLHLPQCADCATYVHPPAPVCPSCRGRQVGDGVVSGRGTVHSFTVNHQQWDRTVELPPYVVAVVELDEQPGLRILTNLVDCDPDQVVVGMAVEVRFVPEADLHLPVFVPVPGTGTDVGPGPAAGTIDASAGAVQRQDAPATFMTGRPPDGEKFEHQVVISGIGRSATGRHLGRTSLDLTIEAILGAIADAGLEPDDIDGLSTWPHENFGPPGFAGPGVATIQDALRLRLNWFQSGCEGINMLGGLGDASMAVAGGMARHVVVVRTMTESSALKAAGQRGFAGGPGTRVSDITQWSVPFGVRSAAQWAALSAQRHIALHGTTERHLGSVAVRHRAHARLNPRAVMRDPLTLDDYLASRLISTPLRLFDCDLPCDGSFAFVISPADHASRSRGGAVGLEAIGTARHTRGYWEQLVELSHNSIDDAAGHMWSRTRLTPADVDVAQLYDGFSIFTLLWLEALGFCEPGQAGPFVADGGTALDGPLPATTSGGQLSEGRFVGMGLLHEACLQLRGQAEGRQVSDAEFAVVGAGGGVVAQALMLRRV